MTISSQQFCINSLLEFFKPGGPVLQKSQLSNEQNRPLLNIQITKGFRQLDETTVEIELTNLKLTPSKNLFRQECFTFNCFEEEGIFTYAPDISTVCLVESTNSEPNKFMSLKQRQQQNKTCFIDELGNTSYFVRGSKDINSNVYVADIGIVNLKSGSVFFVEKNVPFYKADSKTSMYALSTSKVAKGVKIAVIKKVSQFSVETIGTVYGQLENEFYLPHTQLKTNRKYNSKEQNINLENLSINLLLLSNFKQFETIDNQIIYRNINYSSPLLETTVEKSGQTLLNLINLDSVPQEGTIPFNISTFSTNQFNYNSTADSFYQQRLLSCFDSNCFDKDCFEEIVNNNLLNRSIDNKSLGWLVQFLVAYSISYNQENSISLQTILSYLLKQKDKETQLFFKGWDEIQTEEDCEEIITEDILNITTEDDNNICTELTDEINVSDLTYNNSLILNRSIETSTNVSILFALLKAFELTQDFNYIVEASLLYKAIKKYLINSNNLFKHSLTVNETSLDSATYQLLLILVLEEYDSTNELINFFQQRLVSVPTQVNQNVLVGLDSVLVGSSLVELPPNFIIQSDDDFNLFTPTSLDSINSTDDIFKYNYLIYSSLIKLNDKVYIPFLGTISNKYSIIQNKIEIERENLSMLFSIECLINHISFLDFSNLKFNSVPIFTNYNFQEDLIFNNLLLSTPKDYGWFNPSVFTKTSHLGSIYSSIASVLAYTSVKFEANKKLLSIDNMYGILLNKKGADYNLSRFTKEDDSYFKVRIKAEIFNRGINKPAIESKLKLYDSIPTIQDNYKGILSFESIDSFYSSNWGQGYFQGKGTFNTNIATLNFAQPVEEDVHNEILRLKPAGIKINIQENLTFTISKNSTLITIVEVDNNTITCNNIAAENTNNLTTENNSIICTEED